jgi:hypothetical protein
VLMKTDVPLRRRSRAAAPHSPAQRAYAPTTRGGLCLCSWTGLVVSAQCDVVPLIECGQGLLSCSESRDAVAVLYQQLGAAHSGRSANVPAPPISLSVGRERAPVRARPSVKPAVHVRQDTTH